MHLRDTAHTAVQRYMFPIYRSYRARFREYSYCKNLFWQPISTHFMSVFPPCFTSYFYFTTFIWKPQLSGSQRNISIYLKLCLFGHYIQLTSVFGLLLNASLCSLASCWVCPAAVCCWGGSSQRICQSFFIETALSCVWERQELIWRLETETTSWKMLKHSTALSWAEESADEFSVGNRVNGVSLCLRRNSGGCQITQDIGYVST